MPEFYTQFIGKDVIERVARNAFRAGKIYKLVISKSQADMAEMLGLTTREYAEALLPQAIKNVEERAMKNAMLTVKRWEKKS